MNENFTGRCYSDQKSLSVKAVWCTKALEWIARQELETWKHRQVCWTEATRRVQLSRNQIAVDRACRVAVKDLVLNQEDKPKRHRSVRSISHDTAILRLSVGLYRKIIHRDLRLTCFKWCRAQLLCEANRRGLYSVSLTDKQRYRLQ